MQLDENRSHQMIDQKEFQETLYIKNELGASWKKIAPLWPLKNIIAVNPLRGFEELPFAQALQESKLYFHNEAILQAFEELNKVTIKWLQAFFDEGQATMNMPNRKEGLFGSVFELLEFDGHVMKSEQAVELYDSLKKIKDQDIYLVIQRCLQFLKVGPDNYQLYSTLVLTTLPGWSSYIQYRSSWQSSLLAKSDESLLAEYVALRLVIVCCISPESAQKVIDIFVNNKYNEDIDAQLLSNMQATEFEYQKTLCNLLQGTQNQRKIDYSNIKSQLVFCIDVRSELIRRQIEQVGAYQTYGGAGFFGLPIFIRNNQTQEQYASCPVLLKPKSTVVMDFDDSGLKKSVYFYQLMTKIYQSLKYNVITSFAVVEALGLIAGLLIILRSFFSKTFSFLQKLVKKELTPKSCIISLDAISNEDQQQYALQALRLIGLVDNFAPLVIFCGHGAQVMNNAYATALDCGACAGRHGGINGHILASILNKNEIREYLKQEGITIPVTTYFLGAQHTTTTDEITIFAQQLPQAWHAQLKEIQKDFIQVQKQVNLIRSADLDEQSIAQVQERSYDWAQVRPEWGLAGNASFIIGPRHLTQGFALDGRSFLHSYDPAVDADGSLLQAIFAGPLMVTQWINAQYLFSSLDNVAFGSGSKVTQNIVGKIGIMQGNLSDLMIGLPLQSVYKTDLERFHQLQRLTVVVYASKAFIDQLISQQSHLAMLLKNQWIYLICFDPIDRICYKKTTDLLWQEQRGH